MTEARTGASTTDDRAADLLAHRLGAAEWVDDPFTGPTDGAGLSTSGSPGWPGCIWSQVIPGPVTAVTDRTVEEYRYLGPWGEIEELAVAIVWEGARAWIYYSPRGFEPRRIRPALLAADDATHPAGVLGQYHVALRAGDAGRLGATIDEAVRFRDPSGGVLEGRPRATELFSSFKQRGGIPLSYCRLTQEGDRSVVEFTSASTDPAHAGLGVYEVGGAGLLTSIRIYE